MAPRKKAADAGKGNKRTREEADAKESPAPEEAPAQEQAAPSAGPEPERAEAAASKTEAKKHGRAAKKADTDAAAAVDDAPEEVSKKNI